MSDTTESAETTSDAEETDKKGKKAKKEKGGRSNLLPAIILAAGIIGGGYFMGSGGKADAGEQVVVVEAPEPGEIATVEAININLADGHFLRVGLALELVKGIEKKEFESGATAKANDLLISNLGGRSMEELGSAEGRQLIKEQLKEQMKEIYEGDVLEVYFTDFVMQ